jgi:hypothetical protein
MTPTQQQFDETAKRLKIANLRTEILKLALSPRTTRHALRKMMAAGIEGRKEASEIGRKKWLAQQQAESE